MSEFKEYKYETVVEAYQVGKGGTSVITRNGPVNAVEGQWIVLVDGGETVVDTEDFRRLIGKDSVDDDSDDSDDDKVLDVKVPVFKPADKPSADKPSKKP